MNKFANLISALGGGNYKNTQEFHKDICICKLLGCDGKETLIEEIFR